MPGLPDPNVVKNLKNRGRVLDEQIEAASTGKPVEAPTHEAKESKETKAKEAGMPKPSMLTRVLKSITGK